MGAVPVGTGPAAALVLAVVWAPGGGVRPHAAVSTELLSQVSHMDESFSEHVPILPGQCNVHDLPLMLGNYTLPLNC